MSAAAAVTVAALAAPAAHGSLHALTGIAAAANTSVPLQIDGETVAIAAIGTVAALALVYFAVKFAAGVREYLQVRRRDAASDDGENGGGRGSDSANGESGGANRRSDDDRGSDDDR